MCLMSKFSVFMLCRGILSNILYNILARRIIKRNLGKHLASAHHSRSFKMKYGVMTHIQAGKSAAHLMEWKLGQCKLGETDQTPSLNTDSNTSETSTRSLDCSVIQRLGILRCHCWETLRRNSKEIGSRPRELYNSASAFHLNHFSP